MDVAELKRNFAAGIHSRGKNNLVELFRRGVNSHLIKTAMNRAVEKYHGKWVTIGASDHEGGTPVQLDENGQIIKGPKSLAGQNVSSLRPKFPTPGDKGEFKLEGGPAEGPEPKPAQKPLFDRLPSAEEKPGKDSGKPAKLPHGPSQLHPADIKVDPKRFQYKISGIGEGGVTKELKEVRKFNPMLAGQIMVWQDPDNGETYVVNGHHRHELATRTGYDKPLSVYHVEAKNASEARAAGALANIAGGKGTAIDAAKFMRDSGRTVQDLADEGISLSGKIAKDGAVLSKVSPKIFQDLANGLVNEDRALAIGKHVSNPEHQDQLYKILKSKEEKTDKAVPNSVVEEMAREMEMAGSRKSSGSDLFGDFEDEKSNFLERGELKAGIRKLLGEEKTAFKAVAKDKRASRLQAEGKNVLDTEGNKRKAQTAAEALGTFDKLVNTKGPLSDAINAAAVEYGNNPRSKKRILEELHGQIAGLVEQEFRGSAQDGLQQGNTGEAGAADSAASGSGPIEKFSRRMKDQALAYIAQASREKYFRSMVGEVIRFANVHWEESKHPRAEDGKFGIGGGGKAPDPTKKKLDILDAAAGLESLGMTLRHPDPWQPGSKDITYNVTDENGRPTKKTGKEIKGLLSQLATAGQKKPPAAKSPGYASDLDAFNQAMKKKPASRKEPVPEDTDRPSPAHLEHADALIKQPQDKAEMHQMFAAIKMHPYYQEVQKRLKQYGDNPTVWSKEKHSKDGKYTPERQALHDKIVAKMLNPAAKAKPGQKPKAMLLMGSPAAGKTTAGAPMAKKLGVEFTAINPDDAKAALPEYEGWNAAALHEESADITEHELLGQALDQGHNLLFDLTGKNAEKMEAQAEKLSRLGYEVHVTHVKLPSPKAAHRAWMRFRKNAFGNHDPKGEPGRFVPPEYSGVDVNSKPDGTYTRLKNSPHIKSWAQVSTDVAQGEAPKLLESGER